MRPAMTEASFDAERRADTSSKDLELVVHALQQALVVIDEHDPDRNPARCMRQIRRLLGNQALRAAIARLASDSPLAPESAGPAGKR
jgi:tRNA C32,U32 (ribose-2'-O)-methylase TrmJ